MATLPTLLPTADSSVGAWRTDTGSAINLWQRIDEGISGASDADYVQGPNNTNNSDVKFAVTDMPSDFTSISSLSWQFRYALSGAFPGSRADTHGLEVRIMNGTTVLAAASAGGTFQSIVSST